MPSDLIFMEIRGEGASANEDAAREFPKVFLETIGWEVEAHQVFNAAESR